MDTGKVRLDHFWWSVTPLMLGLFTALLLASGCSRLGFDSGGYYSVLADSSPLTQIPGAKGSGNGEGYNGKASYYAVNPADPCPGNIPMSSARSIIQKDSTGFSIVRTECVDHAPQPIPDPALTASPFDPSIVTVNGVIFEQAADPASLSNSYIKVLCRGEYADPFNSSQIDDIDIIIRNDPSGTATSGIPLVPFVSYPFVSYQEEIVQGARTPPSSSYTVTQQSNNSNVEEIPGSQMVSYLAFNSVFVSGPAISQLDIYLNQTIGASAGGAGGSTGGASGPPGATSSFSPALPSQPSLAGSFSGLVNGQTVPQTAVTCSSL